MKKHLTILAAAVAVGISAIAAEPAPAPAASPVTLQNDQCIAAKKIVNQRVYQLSTTVGHDVEVKLGENPAKNELWQPVSYDPAVCRIKIDHEKKGFWPFTCEYAEIEIKGLVRGQHDVVLQCGAKHITIRLNVL